MTLVFPLSTMKCFVVLIFIFSGKKSSFRYTFLLQCLRSAFSLLPVSFCSPLGRCPLPPSGCPLIETSALFPLNFVIIFDFFYFPFNYSQSNILAPSLITSGQMCGFGTLFQVTFLHTGRRKSENSRWLKGKEFGLPKQSREWVSHWFLWTMTLMPFGIRNPWWSLSR